VSINKPRKRFGQNFLNDSFVIANIVKAINPTKDNHFIEIGPGLGAISEPLISKIAKLDAIELDYDLIPKLLTKFNNQNNFTIHQADILKFDLLSVIDKQRKVRIAGNLPFNISTPLLFKLINYINNIQDLHFMLQKEVAHRLIATPGNKSYGRLTIMMQYYFDIQLLLEVPASAFKPAPKVISSFIRLIPKESSSRENIINKGLFGNIVTQAFNKRRKTIKNSLENFFNNDDFIELNIEPKLRPEQLSISDYIILSNYLANKSGKA
jgi:16S rRNA (adenine1518-N6/adenine1519-N6)-dimethyltransferase